MTSRHSIKTIHHYFKEVADIRLEWSLEITKNQINSRNAAIFWIGYEGNHENESAFDNMHQLLKEVNCPPAIIAQQQACITNSLYQGISLSSEVTHAKNSLFLHYFDHQLKDEIRVCLSWKGDQIEIVDYQFELFSHPNAIHLTKRLIHPYYTKLLDELLNNERLINHSGYWTQLKNGTISEIYLTYPWHPPLSTIIPAIKKCSTNNIHEEIEKYSRYHFRHIGISSCHANDIKITLYFSAPIDNETWPNNQNEIESITAKSSKQLHEALELAITD